MHKPDLKLRILYAQTLGRVAYLFKHPASIRPDAVPAELVQERKVPVPRLKGNVFQTLKEIVAIFMAAWREANGAINVAIRTTRTSLAKRCGNLDPKTAYRHILCLIEHGFLRAKVHVKGGLQLLLNPDLIVYEGTQPAFTPRLAPVAAVAATAAVQAPGAVSAGLASLLSVAQGLAGKFTQETRRPS